MKRSFTYASLLILAGWLTACVQPPNYPIEPVITYMGVNKTTVYQGSSTGPSDTLILFFSFTDGDGDLTFTDGEDVIFLYDSRTPTVPETKGIPVIPEDGTGNGIRGEITLRIPNNNSGICCVNPQTGTICQAFPNLPIDTFSYAIEIVDAAGHRSNRIQTEVISILCE
jgi:hypothetical protein